MKSDLGLAVVVLLIGVGVWYTWRELGPGAPKQLTDAERWRLTLDALPRELTYRERTELARQQSDIKVLPSTIAGAQAGSIGGPWGIGIGAAGGALAGIIK